MIEHQAVMDWVGGYEAAWRTAGTEGLAELFSAGAIYLKSPYEESIEGHAAIGRMWEAERDTAAEIFSLASEIVAVDGATAVVRAEVNYGDPVRHQFRDLWVVRFDKDGRCSWFEEWPFWPGRPYAPGVDGPPDGVS